MNAVRADRRGRRLDVLEGRVGASEGDVVADGAANRKPSCGTMPSWLRSDGLLTSRRSWPSTVIAPAGRVVEAREQLHERRLARSRVPDERDGLPGGDREVDAVQHLGGPPP